jgi:hypothetical protein
VGKRRLVQQGAVEIDRAPDCPSHREGLARGATSRGAEARRQRGVA